VYYCDLRSFLASYWKHICRTTMFKTAVLAAIALQGSPVAADGNKCYDGPLTMGDHKVPKEHVINMMVGSFLNTVVKAIKADDGFKKFMTSRGQCQLECAQKQVRQAANAVYGKCGNDLGKDKCRDLAIESLTGAFMSCMPKPPRDEVHQIVGEIVKNMGSPTSEDHSDLFKDNPKCPEAEAAAHFDKDKFQKEFGAAFMSVVDKRKEVKQFFQEKALDCQTDCLKESITESVVTLVGTGNDNKEEGLKALTGASRTCFPGVPRDDVKQLISQVAEVYMKQRTELYESLRLEKLGSSSLSLVYGAAAMSLAVLIAGAGAIRRRVMSGRQQRSCEVQGDDELEEALAAE